MKIRWKPVVLVLATQLLASGCAPLIVGGAAVGGASVVHDRRTAGTVVEDQAIELRIATALAREPGMKQAHINVTSFNGVVLLSGEAPTEALRKRAGDIARADKKARRVHNEIVLAAPSSMMTRSSDALITSRVKGALFKVKLGDFDPTRVKVVTENGTVFLMGLVTHAEGEAATDAARGISGVQRIVKLFEYLD